MRERYELQETLGAGGEARVVKALDLQHGRFVALKIRPVIDARARGGLLNEARVLLAVPPHPALPLVREDFFEGDEYVVAMDWVDGPDLAKLLHERGRPGLAASSVLAYLAQAAEALTHLHAQVPPVIHGDVKPGNLILTRGGRVKLVDFGVSSSPDAVHPQAGTPGFTAPELTAGGVPSRASDIYALAATAFALLTGSAPAGVLPAWDGIDAAVAEQLEAALRRGLATDPAQRPGTPGELIELLRAGWAETLPTGLITFCLSDLVGSTAMWDSEPTLMADALVRHDELITDCVEAHGGRLIKSMGEDGATLSAFDSAPSAVQAAVAAARALAAEPWPGGLAISARFGIHTGAAECRGTDYFGPAVNLVPRLRDQAERGQIFLSDVTAGLVTRHLPDGYRLVDLGPHRLEGVAAPERIHAVGGPGVPAPPAGTDCLYRGLLAFEPEDRDAFFGREDVVHELISRLVGGRLLAVVGASGSGKSSVLRAGVIAAARAGEIDGVEHATLLTPGSALALDGIVGNGLLVVDQFEEVFTLCDEPARRQAFVDALLAFDGPAVVGLRADLYWRLAEHPGLARAVAGNQLLLGAMNDAELERAVTEPARLAGLRLEPGLAELALRDVSGEPGALPLLSHALRATWQRRDGRTLTVAGYRASGGVAAAIARTADGVLETLSPDRRQITRNVFLRLTELGDGVAETRRRVAVGELVPEGASREDVDPLLEQLADARLLTLGEGSVEVAHEVLIREWPTLRGWLEEDRAGIRLQRSLTDAARVWDAGGRETADLARGARLAAAAEWAGAHQEDLNATERAFIDAGVAEADREHRSQQRTNRRLRGLLAGAVSLLLVAAVAGTIALVQRHHARAQALTSDAERLGAQALSDPNVDHALLLAVAGVKLQDRVQTRSDLLAALQQNAALLRLIHPADVEITALRVSPDGTLLAVGDASGTVRFIDTGSWRTRGPVVRLDASVGQRALSFAPDGRTLMALAIGARDSELFAIDVGQRRARRVLSWTGPQPQAPIGFDGLAYSPDGSEVAVMHNSDSPQSGVPTSTRLVVLDAATGRIRWQRRYPLRKGQREPHVVFTAAGTLLTSAQQGETLLWDSHTGRILRRFALGGLPAPAPGGHTVALGQNSVSPGDQSAAIVMLDLRTGSHRQLLANLPASWIRSLGFSADGTKLAGAATDEVHVWDPVSGKIVENFLAQAGPHALSTIDLEHDVLISGLQDGSIFAFDLGGGQRLGREFRWNSPDNACGYTPCMAVNHQATLMASDQSDGTVALVDLRTLRQTGTLPARDGSTAAAIAFMPDGRTLITGGVNRRVSLWDVATRRVTRTLRFAAPVWWVAASPDGKLLAVQTGPVDGSSSQVELLRLDTGAVLQRHASPYGPSGVAFSGDGRELAALGCCWIGSGSRLVAWDTGTGRQRFSLGVGASAFEFAPGSQQLGVGTASGQFLQFDAHTGRRIAPPLQIATGFIAEVSYAPDRRTIAFAAADRTASVWDLPSRTRLGQPFGPFASAVPSVILETNGQLLINLLADGIEWPIDEHAWERFACRAAGRELSPAEWHDLLPQRPYRHVCTA